MKRAALVFPHQLFADHPALSKCKTFHLVEDELFFTQYPFHKAKLAFHRASMKAYQEFLEEQGKRVLYHSPQDSLEDIFDSYDELFVVALDDDWLEQKVSEVAKHSGVALLWLESPAFLSSIDDTIERLEDKLFMASFYQKQRKAHGILLEEDGAPVGGKWSFDAANRKKLPKDIVVPPQPVVQRSQTVLDSLSFVESSYAENPGSLAGFNYATTHEEAVRCMQAFFSERFHLYGDYQDAVSRNDSFLFHSVLSPYINAGLLTPQQVLDAALDCKQVPLNSLEGFVRQILGWREYVRGVYHKVGRVQRTRNFWGHSRSMPAAFYSGTTGIEPLDTVIKRVNDTAYANHIERLMFLGNFMLLCEIDPDEVYRWFMELFIDAYDWVMVPNVYGMSLYADGGKIVTKPYVSSSNYIRKMSRFKKGDWCDIWDGLYWRFIDSHRDFFAENPRLRMMIAHLKRMDADTLKGHYRNAEQFLSALD